MVIVSHTIMTVNVSTGSGENADGVKKHQVGNETYIAYLNTTEEQSKSGVYGFFRVFSGDTLRREVRIKDRTSTDLAFRCVGDLELDPLIERDLQTFILDIECIGVDRQKKLALGE